MPIVSSETSPTKMLAIGHTAVGVAPVRLCDFDKPLTRGVLLRCPGITDVTPNQYTIYVSNSVELTADDSASGGFGLAPGDTLFLQVQNANELFVIAPADGQSVAWLLL